MRVAIIGANRGIGLELARVYRQRGDDVVATCRSPSAALEQLDVQILSGIDVGDAATVAQLAERIGAQSPDLLVNNAGMLVADTFDRPGWDGTISTQFEVNALGPLRVARALAPTMCAGAKIAILSSRVGSLADNTSGGYYGYRMSKAAVNMVGVNLAHELRPRDIAVFLLHPGYVQTGMTDGAGSKPPATAARELVDLLDRLTIADTGSFWHAEGYRLPW